VCFSDVHKRRERAFRRCPVVGFDPAMISGRI
jgi:hypothetical protein